MEIVILIAAVLMLLAGGTYALVKHLKTEYPKGTLQKGFTRRKTRVNVIVSPEVKSLHVPAEFGEKLLSSCVAVFNNVEDVLHTFKSQYKFLIPLPKEINVFIVPTNAWAAAWVTKVDHVPTINVGHTFIEEIVKTGEPVIHETCHVLLDDYVGDPTDHADVRIWKHLGGENSLQYKIEKQYEFDVNFAEKEPS